jgi:hypothetical protein
MSTANDVSKRIPFRMTFHVSGDKYHSGRYSNEPLGIGYEYHHPAKGGYIKTGPKVKVTRHYYMESPKESPTFPTLAALLDANPLIRQLAESLYPAKKEDEQ